MNLETSKFCALNVNIKTLITQLQELSLENRAEYKKSALEIVDLLLKNDLDGEFSAELRNKMVFWDLPN